MRHAHAALFAALVPVVPLVLWAGCGDGAGSARADRPNVILISIDSLRADHLGCYGYARPTSPSIDRLAAEGALFEHVMSSTSWTLPAHAAMFTGLPDSVHGCDRNTRILAPARATLAERFQGSGYRTAGFWSGPYLHPRFGLAQGFDEYTSCTGYEVYSASDIRPDTGTAPERPKGQERADHLSHGDVTSGLVLERVERWLRARERAPFFLFVHLWDVHYDYIPPPPYDSMFDPEYQGPRDGRDLVSVARSDEPLPARDLEHVIALYDGEIAWTDRHVGRLLDLLDELGLAQGTVVALTADHGEEFYEHGRFGHRKALFDESVRVPLVIRYPRAVPAGVRVAGLASVVDIAPTLLELARVAGLGDVLGESLVGRLGASGAHGDAERAVVSELFRPWEDDYLLALRTARWMTIAEPASGERLGLWDLERDPGEREDVLASEGELAAASGRVLRAELERLAALVRRHPLAAELSQGLPRELEEHLRSLGYLGENGGD